MLIKRWATLYHQNITCVLLAYPKKRWKSHDFKNFIFKIRTKNFRCIFYLYLFFFLFIFSIAPLQTNKTYCKLTQSTTWWSCQLNPPISGYAKLAQIYRLQCSCNTVCNEVCSAVSCAVYRAVYSAVKSATCPSRLIISHLNLALDELDKVFPRLSKSYFFFRNRIAAAQI